MSEDQKPTEINEISYGQIAYEAYCNSTEWKSAVTGQPLPQWKEQAYNIRNAWETAASTVAKHILARASLIDYN